MPTSFRALPTLLLLISLALPAAHSASAQEAAPAAAPAAEVSAEYKKTLANLLAVIGAEVAGQQVAYSIVQETLGSIAATGTQVTQQIQDVVVAQAMEDYVPKFANVEYLAELYAPAYAQHLNEKELGEILAFYQSPIGQKAVVAMPQIGQSGAVALRDASFEQMPAFQQRVDVKLREMGIVVEP